MPTHFRGPIVSEGSITSGGSIISTSGVTPSSLGAGVLVTIPMTKRPGTHAAASGTVIPEWRAALPARQMTLQGVGMTFSSGASAPQGGTFRLKVWSGNTAKGVVAGSVGGASFPALQLGGLAATFPASAVARLTLHTVGASAAGGGGQPSLYLNYTN